MAAHVLVVNAGSKLGTLELTSMSPNVEDSVELIRFTQEAAQLLGVLPQRLLLTKEFRRLVALGSLYRTLIQRCGTAFGRGNGQICLAFKLVVRMGEFGQVPTPGQSNASSDIAIGSPSCFLAGITKLVVRAEDDEDLGRH